MKINQSLFNKILKKNYLFEKNPSIAVAVSGGPDSMALIFLLNNWIKTNDGELIALIVDHGIRKNSNLESRKIKKYLYSKNISSKIFLVDKKYVAKKNMSEARKNRFNKLINYCINKKILHLFLAHHGDDNIETFLLRKIAGSNIEGLRSIQSKVNLNGVQVLRPLLDFNKKEILNYNKIHSIFFVKDPSNLDLKYSRVIVRNFLKENDKFKRVIYKDFNLIKFYYPYYKKMIFQKFIKSNTKISNKAISFDAIKFFNFDQEIQIKIIEIIYKFLKPKRELLRYSKIIKSLEILNQKDEIKTNLAGMDIKKDVFLLSFAS